MHVWLPILLMIALGAGFAVFNIGLGMLVAPSPLAMDSHQARGRNQRSDETPFIEEARVQTCNRQLGDIG